MRNPIGILMEVVIAAGWLCSVAAAATSPLADKFPKASPEALALVDGSPLIKQALTDPQFFDKLENDQAFYKDIFKQLGLQAYRHFGPVPSVRVRILRGTPAEYPFIMLEYQTKFDGLSNWGSGPFQSGSCVFIGGGRDATPSRTVYGGSEDPQVRARWHELLAERQRLPSNRRRSFDPVIDEFLRKNMPSTPLEQVQKEIDAQVQTLLTGFSPYGAEKLAESHMGQVGYKLADKLYLHVRTFQSTRSGDEDDNHFIESPYFWVLIGGGPRPMPTQYLPAFPGAEGFGALTTGGRGGKVVYVTTLAPQGPGSLAEALNTKGPRTVLFKVSGQIVLPDETWIAEPNLTLIGHTAPGEGVEVCGRLCIAADNIIMRGMRWRMRPPQAMDGMNTRGDLKNIIFDHCSFAYGSDEIIRFIGERATFVGGTIQYTILGPGTGGLGSHPYGPEVGGIVSFHHNILYNTFSRSPEVDCDLMDWRNNILYNVRSGHSRRLTSRLNYVNNVIISNPEVVAFRSSQQGQSQTGSGVYTFRTNDNNFIDGNLIEVGKEITMFDPGRSAYLKSPYMVMPVTNDKPTDLEAKLLPTIGASLPIRDATDAHWIEGLKTRTGKPVYWEDHTGQWRSYNPGSNEMINYESLPLAKFPAPAKAGAAPDPDSDNDGMPDAWEQTHKLGPKDPSDAKADPDKDGYTNLEEFLNRTDPQKFVDYKDPKNNIDLVFKT